MGREVSALDDEPFDDAAEGGRIVSADACEIEEVTYSVGCGRGEHFKHDLTRFRSQRDTLPVHFLDCRGAKRFRIWCCRSGTRIALLWRSDNFFCRPGVSVLRV